LLSTIQHAPTSRLPCQPFAPIGTHPRLRGDSDSVVCHWSVRSSVTLQRGRLAIVKRKRRMKAQEL